MTTEASVQVRVRGRTGTRRRTQRREGGAFLTARHNRSWPMGHMNTSPSAMSTFLQRQRPATSRFSVDREGSRTWTARCPQRRWSRRQGLRRNGDGRSVDDPERNRRFMNEALKEAKRAYDEEEVPIGAVLVLGDEIVCRHHNRTESLSDPTAHAEMLCIRQAAAMQESKHMSYRDGHDGAPFQIGDCPNASCIPHSSRVPCVPGRFCSLGSLSVSTRPRVCVWEQPGVGLIFLIRLTIIHTIAIQKSHRHRIMKWHMTYDCLSSRSYKESVKWRAVTFSLLSFKSNDKRVTITGVEFKTQQQQPAFSSSLNVPLFPSFQSKSVQVRRPFPCRHDPNARFQ